MPRSRQPFLLFVDDHPEDAAGRAYLVGGRIKTAVKSPEEVTERDLEAASVVLVDLGLRDWLEQLPLGPLSTRPQNGLALTSVMRSHCKPGWPPTAFTLHTGKLRELSDGLPPRSQAHVIARANKLEWVFSKDDQENVGPFVDQVLALSEAVAALPLKWPVENSELMKRTALRLLGLGKTQKWTQRAWRTVERCHPPMHSLGVTTNGLSFVRWLLHQVLPFPGFLVDATYLAARLRVTPASFRLALDNDVGFFDALEPYRYKGILCDFLGRRWWKAGIEHLLWSKTASKSFSSDAQRIFVGSLSGMLEPVEISEPVVVLNEELQPQDELVDISNAVELYPDDWPAFADSAWGERTLVEQSPRLQSIRLLRE